jgi:hypothetical protein
MLAGGQVKPVERLLLLDGGQRRVFLLAGRREDPAVAVEFQDFALNNPS